ADNNYIKETIAKLEDLLSMAKRQFEQKLKQLKDQNDATIKAAKRKMEEDIASARARQNASRQLKYINDNIALMKILSDQQKRYDEEYSKYLQDLKKFNQQLQRKTSFNDNPSSGSNGLFGQKC